VVSPGVPDSGAWLGEARRRGLRTCSELELGWSRLKCRCVAIPGSNGKSTAVKWFAESLRQAGLRAAPAGNYGFAASEVARARRDLDWAVLEVSSFQLETVERFRAEVGILLNVLPNHLDRHGDVAAYRRLKARLFAATTPGDWCVAPEADADAMKRLSGGRGQWITFGASGAACYRYEGGRVYRGDEEAADFSGTYFANEVYGLAAAAVTAGLRACGVDSEAAVRAARAFSPLPHRMQFVREIGGVRYVNDSKATNLAAMSAALRMIPGGARLIAGGLVKEKDFGAVKEVLVRKVTGVYLIGKAEEEMASAWAPAAPCFRCGKLETAVRRASADAQPGETVLLSPGCASFDQFRNFEERGQRFIEIVATLAEEKEE
jgi:UDP-N-acetylmuramoylalanine--D-glutamate ligase